MYSSVTIGVGQSINHHRIRAVNQPCISRDIGFSHTSIMIKAWRIANERDIALKQQSTSQFKGKKNGNLSFLLGLSFCLAQNCLNFAADTSRIYYHFDYCGLRHHLTASGGTMTFHCRPQEPREIYLSM